MAFTLPKNNSGIPLLGIGSGTYYYKATADQPANPLLVKIFSTALKEGFIHLDSAECYKNDAELKETLDTILSTTDLKREDIFITDKYYAGDGTYTTHSTFSNPYERIKAFNQYLNTPYTDLYLLHAPFIKKESHGFDLKEAWKYMQQALDEGLVKQIGVSNFAVDDIEEIWDTTKSNPQVNQIEFNAFLQNQTPGIVDYCKSKNITVEAYSPLAPIISGDLTNGAGLKFIELIDELASKYKKTRTQILLKWVIERGIVPITTTSKLERFEEFKGIFDNWNLSAADVDAITKAGAEYKPSLRKYWNPEYSKYN